MILTKYNKFWAVYDNDNKLVCVCVYKKGAMEVIRRLENNKMNLTIKKKGEK